MLTRLERASEGEAPHGGCVVESGWVVLGFGTDALSPHDERTGKRRS
jgi:hypothetical protein